jgi:hypothetical protein
MPSWSSISFKGPELRFFKVSKMRSRLITEMPRIFCRSAVTVSAIPDPIQSSEDSLVMLVKVRTATPLAIVIGFISPVPSEELGAIVLVDCWPVGCWLMPAVAFCAFRSRLKFLRSINSSRAP